LLHFALWWLFYAVSLLLSFQLQILSYLAALIPQAPTQIAMPISTITKVFSYQMLMTRVKAGLGPHSEACT